MSRICECGEVVFDCVAVCTNQFHGLGDGEASTLPGQLQYANREIGQVAKHQPLPFDLLLQNSILTV